MFKNSFISLYPVREPKIALNMYFIDKKRIFCWNIVLKINLVGSHYFVNKKMTKSRKITLYSHENFRSTLKT